VIKCLKDKRHFTVIKYVSNSFSFISAKLYIVCFILSKTSFRNTVFVVSMFQILSRTFSIESVKLRMLDVAKGEGVIVSAGKDGRVKYWDLDK